MAAGSFLFKANDDSGINISRWRRFKIPAAEGVDSYVAVVPFIEDIVDTKMARPQPTTEAMQ